MAFAMMLNDLGETDKAAKLNAAILAQVEEGKVVTADIGGTAGTKEFTRAVIARLYLRQHRTIPALRLKHRSGGCGTHLRCKMLDKTSSIICAFGLASAAPRSPYRHLELCGIALTPHSYLLTQKGVP